VPGAALAEAARMVLLINLEISPVNRIFIEALHQKKPGALIAFKPSWKHLINQLKHLITGNGKRFFCPAQFCLPVYDLCILQGA
jgi:hypothetical protein